MDKNQIVSEQKNENRQRNRIKKEIEKGKEFLMSWGFCFLCRLLLSNFFWDFFAHVQNFLFILSLDDFQFNQKH